MMGGTALTAFLLSTLTIALWPWIGALLGITASNARGYHPLFGLVAGLVMGPFVLLVSGRINTAVERFKSATFSETASVDHGSSLY